jgi:hypothetical protein
VALAAEELQRTLRVSLAEAPVRARNWVAGELHRAGAEAPLGFHRGRHADAHADHLAARDRVELAVDAELAVPAVEVALVDDELGRQAEGEREDLCAGL